MVALVTGSDTELFLTADGDAYATVTVEGCRQTWLLKSKGFRRYVSRLFYYETGKTPNAQATQEALGVLEGMAVFDGEEHPVHLRIAGDAEVIYLDLCNEQW